MNSAPPSSRARALGVALVVLAVLATAARAEVPAAGGDEKEARRLFQEAELSFNVGKFPEALASYQAAYEAKPLPGFLFNIAQCYRNMGDYERARFFFRRYLTLDPRTPNRRRVEALIEEMGRLVPQQPAEPAASAEAAPPPAPPAVEPPAAPAAPLPPVAAAEAPVVVAPAPAPEPRPLWRRWWFWAAAGVVVAGAAVTAVVLARPETRAPGTLDPIEGP
jgi:tetratricopeptide (TPR) repeat protein